MRVVLIINHFIFYMQDITKNLIPLSFTIFFFAFREQKEVAYSLFKRKRYMTTIFVLLTVIMLFLNIIYAKKRSDILTLSAQDILMLSIDIAWLFIAYITYKWMINAINVTKTFEKETRQIHKKFNKIFNLIRDIDITNYNENYLAKRVKKIIKEIRISTEIVFQILLTKKKFNLSSEFSSSLRTLEEFLFNNVKEINDDQKLYSFLVIYSGFEYKQFYEVLHKGLVDIFDIVIKSNNSKDISFLLEKFYSTRANTYEIEEKARSFWNDNFGDKLNVEDLFLYFYEEYFYSAFLIINKLDENKDGRTVLVIKKLIQQDAQTNIFSNEEFLLTFFSSLIISSIENDNLKQLTDTFNVLIDLLRQRKIKFNKEKIPEKINRISKNIDLGRIEKITGEFDNRNFENAERKIYRFVFLSIVKAIELGRYKCAGFLIKGAIKNFDVAVFNSISEEIYKNNQDTSPDLKLGKKLTSLLPHNYNFSLASYEYCLMKSILLLYYQQLFTTKEFKINEHINSDLIDVKNLFKDNFTQVLYINEKLSGLNKEYGLLFLSTERFDKIKLTKDNMDVALPIG